MAAEAGNQFKQARVHARTLGADEPRRETRPSSAPAILHIAVVEEATRVVALRRECDHPLDANGLDGTRLRKQWKEIDRINRELDDFLVLKGVECDILEKGGMDLPDDVLAELAGTPVPEPVERAA